MPKPNYRKCGQVAFWTVAVTPQLDLIKWGEHGNTIKGFDTYDEAEAQAHASRQSGLHNNDRFFILNVFPNGQIRTDEVDFDREVLGPLLRKMAKESGYIPEPRSRPSNRSNRTRRKVGTSRRSKR